MTEKLSRRRLLAGVSAAAAIMTPAAATALVAHPTGTASPGDDLVFAAIDAYKAGSQKS
jgi:hypothetical protein